MRRGLISIPSLPVEFIEGGATLSPGKEYWVTAAAKLTLAKSARLGDRLKVVNSAEVSLTISGSAIGGVDNTGNRYADQSSVRLPAGGEADFVRSRRGWRARGCDRAALRFVYNGQPLALNEDNPGKASDLIHYLGGVSSFANPTTSGVIIAAASSVFSGAGQPTVLTDRVANSSTLALNWMPNNQANSWIAWQFPSNFSPTGFLLQTAAYTNNYHPRSFQIHYSNDLSTALTSASPVTSWTQGPGWTNQTQITGAGTWHFFPFSGAGSNPVTRLPNLRRTAILFNGPSSDGANWSTVCEVCWFGDSEV